MKHWRRRGTVIQVVREEAGHEVRPSESQQNLPVTEFSGPVRVRLA